MKERERQLSSCMWFPVVVSTIWWALKIRGWYKCWIFTTKNSYVALMVDVFRPYDWQQHFQNRYVTLLCSQGQTGHLVLNESMKKTCVMSMTQIMLVKRNLRNFQNPVRWWLKTNGDSKIASCMLVASPQTQNSEPGAWRYQIVNASDLLGCETRQQRSHALGVAVKTSNENRCVLGLTILKMGCACVRGKGNWGKVDRRKWDEWNQQQGLKW